jgi:hypothetical protein
MKTLKELYESGKDIRESEIPTEWRKSFLDFMIGSTITADFNEDGSVKEYIYYSHDFREWYNINKSIIERDSKINDILDL